MTAHFTIKQAGPALSLQDLGRPGYRAQGLTAGGAADRTAVYEGAAILGQEPDLAVIEMAGFGGTFAASQDMRIALTGAEMVARIDGEALAWNASHLLPANATLNIAGARNGSYGYLHIGGGFDTPRIMGSRTSHLSGGIGSLLQNGDQLPVGRDQGAETALKIAQSPRFGGGKIRVVTSMQTNAFADETISRFTATPFRRDARANRMGVRLDFDGDGFTTEAQLSIVSEVVVPGDIQISGDGAPYVLMYECQTTGGYPRIGSVIPCDLPKVSQAQIGAPLQFEFIDIETAIDLQNRHLNELKSLRARVGPIIRDAADIRDLLTYQLISGVASATADPFKEEF